SSISAVESVEVYMIRKFWFALLVTALVVSGCSGIQVSQDYDPATDFGSLKTYRWASASQAKTGDLRIDNPLRDKRIREAVVRHLAEKGFIQSTEDAPNFLVRYQYVLRQKIESDGGGIGFGIGSYGHSGGIAIGTGTGNNLRGYDEGSLTIDFIDSGSQALLWRGTGSQRFKEYDDPAKTTADINALVESILAQFPPQNQ
ncbi:DUF4136 domain-containing protein, partial [Desulfosarcina sp.]|uniref:DUF4136 domain-containing protein n=1 Tax=Desulfosarcina sp. TaxID=2027861 RepID=UPI00397049CA